MGVMGLDRVGVRRKVYHLFTVSLPKSGGKEILRVLSARDGLRPSQAGSVYGSIRRQPMDGCDF